MPTIKIVSWSFQEYGPLMSGLMHGNEDLVSAIATVVVDFEADLFVLLNLASAKGGTAKQVSAAMAAALQAASVKKGKTGEFKSWVLSANIGVDYYAFFVRDSAVTTPIPVTGTTAKPDTPPKILGQDGDAITDAIFTTSNAEGELAHAFPYLSPDLPIVASDGSSTGIPKWTGDQRPALGLFSVHGASTSNQLLPLIVCSFSADQAIAVGQIRTLPNFSLLKNLGPNPPAPAPALTPVSLQIVPIGGGAAKKEETSYYSLTGDFNVDYRIEPELFAPLTSDLGAAHGMDFKTLLVTINDFDPSVYDSTSSLAIKAFDNFFTRASAAAATPVAGQNPKTVDIPSEVSKRQIELKASVQYYAQLDSVGVPPPDIYSCLMMEFGRQLAAVPPKDLDVENALIGARLISAHLPIYLELAVG
jgi:hypothetical protein